MVEGNFADDQLDDGWAFEIDDGWGWEVEIDGDGDSTAPRSPGGLRISLKPTVPRALSKSQESESSLISRVKSSSSFQELERAIGATLAMGLGEVDLSKKDEHVRMINGVISQKATLGRNLRMRSYNSMSRIRSDSLGSREASSVSFKQIHSAAAASMKSELKPFLDEPESRALVLFHSPDVASYDIKSTCKMFGALYYFRSDFHSFGITLVCYSDLRCAVDAHRSLRTRLGRLADATPFFSVILHSSHGCDESKLCISRVPSAMAEGDIQAIFARYGPLRSIQKSFNDGGVGSALTGVGNGPSVLTCDYTVEYFSMQDAKVAQSEIQASILNIVGPDSDVYFVVFERRQEQARREALSILHSWRVRLEELEGRDHILSPSHQIRHVSDKGNLTAPVPPGVLPVAAVPTLDGPKLVAHESSRPPSSTSAAKAPRQASTGAAPGKTSSKSAPAVPASQAQPHPHGMYYSAGMPFAPHGMVPLGGPAPGMYHMMPAPYYNPVGGMYSQAHGMVHATAVPEMGAGRYGPASYQAPSPYFGGAYYVPYGAAPMPMPVPAGLPLSPAGSYENLQFALEESPYHDHRPLQQQPGYGAGYEGRNGGKGYGYRGGNGERRPPHHNGGHSLGARRGGGRSHGISGSSHMSSPEATTDAEYTLSPDRLGSGSEKRTTVMIRNIPNKYTQSMLLEEINAKFDGMYDFFYLPIDFKNRCNVGYAFINFLEASSVVHFFDEFNGQRWRNFNSEKVCSITYARIQGKAAMIARFQNSSLLEKDDSYKPLLFVSKGPNKGAPEAFPSRHEGEGQASAAAPAHH